MKMIDYYAFSMTIILERTYFSKTNMEETYDEIFRNCLKSDDIEI